MTGTVLEHRYRPRGAARTLLSSREPEVLLSGPAGTGKSRACLEKLHMMAVKNPGMRGLIVRKTQVSMTNTALVTFREHVASEAIEAGIVRWYGGSQQEAAGYHYAEGSVINVGGMDKPTKIMSSDYDTVYVQEAIELSRDDWEAITTRLRNGRISFQQLIADTNPDRANHWLKKRSDTGTTTMLPSHHRDNPRLYDEDGQVTEYGAAYMVKLDALTGVRRLRLRDGLWVSAEGAIYEDQWRPELHLINRFVIPDTWTRYWAVDFGHTHPFVLQCWAEDPDGRLFRYREIYMTRRLVEDHAKTILRIVCPGGKIDPETGVLQHGRWKEPKPSAIICDHDAEDRATLEKHLGLSTVAAKKSVSDGIEHVQARMKPALDDKPRIFLLRDSLVEKDQRQDQAELPTCTEEEIPGYRWNEDKDQPVKEQDDGCDTMRYMVAERDLGARPNIRWM